MKLTASTLSLIASGLFLLVASVVAAPNISPDNSNIRYIGRWDQSNSSQPWAYAKGSSIIANFDILNSDSCAISATFSGSTTDYLRVIIDDDASTSYKIQISSGSSSHTLASGLCGAVHKIEIAKETDAGRWTFHGFELDGGITSPPAALSRKLVFYGDSNLAGYSLAHEQNQSAQSLRGSYYGLAGIVSRMFDAEYSNISRSGATIRTLHASYDRIDWFTPGLLWGLTSDQPDAVIINIGANDVGRPKRKIKKDYHSFLDDMRQSYPNAHIVLYNGWGWDYNEPANYTHEVVDERRDPNMSVSIFPWLFEQWHGSEYDHGGMAHQLAEHLASILNWTAAPADVMSGYGIDGDVANGSFEDIVPFGGYGWRYYTDTGVSRLDNQGGAQHGNYYLRLADGAAVHQPNPATDGDSFTVSFWLRAANDAQLKVSVDFRTQHIWTDPLDSITQTFYPTNQWAKYVMTASAPTGTSNPVFQTRLTFQAASGSTVDIDNVVMSLDGGSETCVDNDRDGYGNPGSATCNQGAAHDCDDFDTLINPGAEEILCNGKDDDCNPSTPDDDPLVCPVQMCAIPGDSCRNINDCCSGNCSKGKPSNRICQ